MKYPNCNQEKLDVLSVTVLVLAFAQEVEELRESKKRLIEKYGKLKRIINCAYGQTGDSLVSTQNKKAATSVNNLCETSLEILEGQN
ncbi:hypothetical protein KAR91_51760 [Candidatus Pacearchaeota archaeon]|nr:hypothetical protein [Candidatus Pacearchaeota archaeon]